MGDSRATTSPRPQVPYGSKGYLTLYYARMVKRPFTGQDVKHVFSGKFTKDTICDISDTASRLVKIGMLKKLKMNLYQITPKGIEQMAYALAYHREMQYRNLGVSYMKKVSERSAVAQMKKNLAEQLDIEEEILTEVETKMRARANAKTKSNRAKKKN